MRGAAESALREADQRKDVFLATLAHELRNPLAPIRNAAQVLAAPNLRPEKLEWAQTVIQRQVRHMASLLDDLMDVARITQGKVELRKQRITLSDVVDSALEASRPLLDRKKHQLVLALPVEQVHLDADPVRLSQVLANLLTNAAKYTDAGGRITLSGRVDNGSLTLAVKDNGIGISPQALPQVFEMFSQAEDALTRSEGGLGIGLALVKGLVELHGGSVEARSSGAGAGSEFIVRLPVAAAAQTPRLAEHSGSARQTGKRILVADDNRDAAESLGLLLEMAGHDVRIAHDGRAALELANSFRPNWGLLDIGMPQLNGYEVASALRQQPWAAEIQLIALTGWGQDGDRQRAIAAGFDRHLTKPVDPDALLALIQSCTHSGQ
jgi:CheY-like chemotaxis protein